MRVDAKPHTVSRDKREVALISLAVVADPLLFDVGGGRPDGRLLGQDVLLNRYSMSRFLGHCFLGRRVDKMAGVFRAGGR